jgi:hypothetical protein
MSTIKEWVKSNYTRDDMFGIIEHGCVSGSASGLIYYADTCKFHDEFEDEIWEMLHDDAEAMGHKDVLELIASFNGGKNVGSMTQLKNLLCWYAVERECNSILSGDE